MLNDANRKLRTAQQGAKTLESLPLLYILGDSGTAKTTTVLRSGLDPELLAGTATLEADQVSTGVLNLWFTKAAALLEVGTSVRQNNALLGRLVHRTRARAYRSAFGSGAAPRAVVVCVSADQLLVADAGQSLMASARATGRATARDQPPARHAGAGVRHRHQARSRSPLRRVRAQPFRWRSAPGPGLAPAPQRSLGRRLRRAGLAHCSPGCSTAWSTSSANSAWRCSTAKTMPANVAGVYEFPREFGKLRKNLNQYLVEVCKPSQLSANPYLRGFYFTGIRARIVERAVSAPAPVERSRSPGRRRDAVHQSLQPARPAAPPRRARS